MLGKWHIRDVGCWGCGMLGMWDVGDVGCWGCGMLGMWDVWDVGCSGCGMFGMWDVRDVGCLGCGMFAGMWDVGLQNATFLDSFIILVSMLHAFTVLFSCPVSFLHVNINCC